MLTQGSPEYATSNVTNVNFKTGKIINQKPKTDSLYKSESLVRKATKADPFLNEEQYSHFKNALLGRRHGFRDYLMVVMQHTTGRRISDIVKLNVGDVYDIEGQRVKSYFEVFEKKTKKYKKLEIFYPLDEAISVYVDSIVEKGVELYNDMPLFMSQVQNKIDKSQYSSIGRIQEKSAWRIYKEAADACGIDRNETHISTHSPRKYLVKKHVEKYNDVKLMTHFLNHSDESTTLIYACITDEQVNDSLKAMFQA